MLHPQKPRIKNVSNQILDSHIKYGGSDNTNQNSTANGKLNYVHGPSFSHAWPMDIYTPNNTQVWEDAIGLQGAENKFIRYNPKFGDTVDNICWEEPGWDCLKKTDDAEQDPKYEGVAELGDDQTSTGMVYLPARYLQTYPFPKLKDGWMSVRVENLGTGNTYNDKWFDVRLYTKDREEHPYDLMYVRKDEHFFVGFHARNTRQIAYNVKIHVAEVYVEYDRIIDKRFVRRTNDYGNYVG